MESWVIRLSLVDQPDQPLLLHVSRKTGGQNLDLDLIATDGDAAYRTKVRQRKLDSYRSDSYEGTAEEWSSILTYAFVSSKESQLLVALRDSLEIACNVSGKSKRVLKITLRTRVEDITHKLGTIELTYSEDTADVDLFTWTASVVEKRDVLTAELQEGHARLQRAEEEVELLNKQLQELVLAKQEHESQMLSKFALLLNEKKLRIRTQQRQIAGSGHPTRRKGSKTSTKSVRKRKAVAEEEEPQSGEESDGFEAMDVDQVSNEDGDTDPEGARTPSNRSDTDTDSDAPQPAGTADTEAKSPRAPDAVPPRRALPFSRKANTSVAFCASSQNAAPVNTKMQDTQADEDTASEDDEL